MKTQKIYSAADLKKFNVSNLAKIATEELGLTVKETDTKHQISKAIIAAQSGEKPAPQKEEAKTPAAVTPTKEVAGKEVHITATKVGAVIRYKSSKKMYLVADIFKKGEVEARLLYSATQRYISTKNDFNVIEVIAGTGKLDDKIAAKFDELVKGDLKSAKNVDFNTLYEAVKLELKTLAEKAAKKTEAKPIALPAVKAVETAEAPKGEGKPLTKKEKEEVKIKARHQAAAKKEEVAETAIV